MTEGFILNIINQTTVYVVIKNEKVSQESILTTAVSTQNVKK
jgi:hypothetical protein